MTAVTFFTEQDKLVGFYLAGHSSDREEDEQGRIVCAAVSSAAYMTANTLTEIIGADAQIEESEACMRVKLLSKIGESQEILAGFRLHIEQLAKQYKTRIKFVSEV